MRRHPGARYKKFSQGNAEYLCQEVQRMEDSKEFDASAFVEALRELTEVVIWSDKNAENVFDIFLERDVMSTFERVVTNAEFPSVAKVQAIQCITMMLQNFTRKQSIYFVCSNNHLNRIISIAIDENDDELLSIYVSFLKSLALRLNEDTVQFFFEGDTRSFPLFDRAAKLLGSPDRMVRAAVRQVVIGIAHLNDGALALFLRDALKEIFTLISTLLWTQIKSLAEEVAKYGNIEHSTSEAGLPVLSIAALRDRLEDIVDDLFYINDLFVIPHAFVPSCLKGTLDDIVISPLVRSLKGPPSDPFRFSSSNSLHACFPVSVAFSVLTRWVQLNKSERLNRLFRERLLIPTDPHGGVVGQLLRGGSIQTLPGAVMLLNALVTARLLEEDAGEDNDNNNNNNNNNDSKEDEWRFDVVDFLNASWNIEQQPSDSALLPPPELRPIVSCDVFIKNKMFQRAESSATRKWSHSLMVALYFFITRPSCTPFCVFNLALRLLLLFVHEERGCVFHFRGLLLLSLSIIMRRIVSYGDSSALQNDDTVTSTKSARTTPTEVWDSPGSSSSVDTKCNNDNNINNNKSKWLKSPYEVLFIKIENVCKDLNPWMEKKSDSTNRADVSLLLPLLPSLDFVRSEKSKEEESNYEVSWDAVLSNPQEYMKMQKSIAVMVPQQNRAAHDRSEEEKNEFLMWLTIRHYIHHILGTEDGFITRLRNYGIRHHVGDSVIFSRSGLVYFRCEFVKGRFLFGASPPKVAAGTPMYMVLLNTEILFLEAGDVLPFSASGVALRVLFSLQMIYVQATVSQSSFRVIVTHVHPDSPLQLHIVFRHGGAAESAVDMMTKQSSFFRSVGAALVYRAVTQQGSPRM